MTARVRSVLFALVGAAALLGFGVGSASAAQHEYDKYSLEQVSASLSTYQAGAHPDLTTRFVIASDPSGTPDGHGHPPPYAATKDIEVATPPGLIGNLNTVTMCRASDFLNAFAQVEDPTHEGEAGCPYSSQVGVTKLILQGLNLTFNEPVYLIEPPEGGNIVARLAFFAYAAPVYINIRSRSDSDYGLTATLEQLPSNLFLLEATTTIWGVPGAHSHDLKRTLPWEYSKGASEPREFGRPPEPFLTNPTSCNEPIGVTFSTDSYQIPGRFSTLKAPLRPITGCEAVAFEPSFSAVPTTPKTEAPTGLDSTLTIPQDETPEGIGTSQLRDATVTLPKGVTIAPGAADGLEACSDQQAGYKELHPAECPQAAKIGSATFDVPALRTPLQGGIYQRTPAPGDLFRIWLIADEQGVHVALPGDVHADPLTGQLTAVFLENPQVPLRELKLHFRVGSRAPLSTPASCGLYQTKYEFSPWDSGETVTADTPMTISENCQTGGFAPKITAGSSSAVSGAFANFSLDLTRQDGEQNVSALDVTLPPGLLARLAGVTLCGPAAATSGNCPSASQIGTTSVASGPGPAPLWIPQPGKEATAVYLGGPYKGGPYSLVVKVPAQAGPFDLGDVVVRSALFVDPNTTQVTVKTDPLPQILQGVPVAYRTVHVSIDRPKFILNPTSCEPQSVSARLTSPGGSVATPSSPFQVGECGSLKFKPKFSISLNGPTKRSGFPALRAVVKTHEGEANIGKAVVTLPHSEFLEQGHIRTVCTRVQFAAEACPAGSIYGRATAITPLLAQPVTGPVYLRSNPEHELPDLVAALHGGVDVDLVGQIDSVHARIRTTFAAVPDAPVSRFVLEMQGGQKGLLVNSRNICKTTNLADAKFQGQNGNEIRLAPPVVAKSCPGPAGAKRAGRRAGHEQAPHG